MSDNFKLTTPVMFMVFNRPSKTRLVFEAIAKAKPTKLFVIADGPRSKNKDDQIKCQEVRGIIDKGINWECEVVKNYASENMGCKNRISSGLDWVFSQVKEAIVLEDDCLPDQSFFRFCQELLEKYRHNPKIMHIGGFNFNVYNKNFNCQYSYYFSNIGSIIGWATWRRAWQNYDVNIKNWPEIKKAGILQKIIKNDAVVNHYNHLYDAYYAKTIDSWDSQWFLTRWSEQGLSIVPRTNLIKNIGFDTEAAHKAIDPKDPRAHVPVKTMDFPLVHPDKIETNRRYDDYIFRYQLGINKLVSQRLLWFINKKLPTIHRLLKFYKRKK